MGLRAAVRVRNTTRSQRRLQSLCLIVALVFLYDQRVRNEQAPALFASSLHSAAAPIRCAPEKYRVDELQYVSDMRVFHSAIQVVHRYEFQPSKERPNWQMVRNTKRNPEFWDLAKNKLTENCGRYQGLCQCSVRRSIGMIRCAYVDSGVDMPGQVFDREHVFPVHPFIWNLTANASHQIVTHAQLANGLSVYGSAFAHASIEILPQLLHLLQHIPKSVPILVDMNGSGGKWVDILNQLGLSDPERWVALQKSTIYFARQLYFNIVEVRSAYAQPSREWKLLREEEPCSWRTSIPSHIVRATFCKPVSPLVRSSEQKKRIAVIHRREVKSRQIENHVELYRSLSEALPDHIVMEFIGDEHTLLESIALFCSIDVLVAPHGAGLIYMQFLPENAAVIEIGYASTEVMKWPIDYYAGNALVLNLRYYLSVAKGGYLTSLQADVDDVLSLTRAALEPINS